MAQQRQGACQDLVRRIGYGDRTTNKAFPLGFQPGVHRQAEGDKSR